MVGELFHKSHALFLFDRFGAVGVEEVVRCAIECETVQVYLILSERSLVWKRKPYICIHAPSLRLNTFLNEGIRPFLNPSHNFRTHDIRVGILARNISFLLAMLHKISELPSPQNC